MDDLYKSRLRNPYPKPADSYASIIDGLKNEQDNVKPESLSSLLNDDEEDPPPWTPEGEDLKEKIKSFKELSSPRSVDKKAFSEWVDAQFGELYEEKKQKDLINIFE